MTPFKPVRPGQQLSARALNQHQDATEAVAKLTAAPPLELVRQADGYHLRLNPDPPLVAVLNVTGASSVGPGMLDYYPAAVDLFRSSDGTFFQTLPVWLVSRQAASLQTNGDGYYMAVLQDAAVAIGDDGRPVYVTCQYRSLTAVACDDGDLETTLGP